MFYYSNLYTKKSLFKQILFILHNYVLLRQIYKIFMKITFVILILSIISNGIFAQTKDYNYNTPYTHVSKLSLSDIDHIIVTPPSIELIEFEDKQSEKDGTMYKIGRLLPINYTTENSGTWLDLEDGTILWRLRLSSEGAKASAIHFDYFNLRPDSRLFIYDIDYKTILGPFTYEDNPNRLEYSIGVLKGNDIIIEYILPKQDFPQKDIYSLNENFSDFKISAYSYIYRGEYLFFDDDKATGYGASEYCQVNINCLEGNNWRTQQKGIARIYAVEGWTIGYCTGSLINNTSNDQKPYILTANHCGATSTTSNFNQWRFDFNYESPGCISTSEPNAKSFTGCSKKASGALNGGSDFLLVELYATPTQLKNANVVYNGWRNNNIGSPSGISIHHPSGDIKKISTYTNSLTSTTYYGDNETGAPNAHWRTVWSRTTNGHGVTEGGSSGSPIFDNNGYIIGTLSGGSSYCNYTSGSDLYGKMSYHWISNGSSTSSQLKPWLDPNNTNSTNCEYFDPNNTNIILADFSANKTQVAVGGQLNFTDISTSSSTIQSRSWVFQGGIPSNSTLTNPNVFYNSPGLYNVSLTITTANGSNTKTKEGYIKVGSNGFSFDFENCTDFAVDEFSPCTTYDGDGKATYGSTNFDFYNEGYTGSFIAFNHNLSTPPSGDSLKAHSGSKFGACFAATDNTVNNDWFITPILNNILPSSTFSFWAKSATSRWGLERFKVLISTTDNSISSFTNILDVNYIQAPTTWTKYEFNLDSYIGQNIFIAIQCVSFDAFSFMIDDLNLISDSSVIDDNFSKKVKVFPNPSFGTFKITLTDYDKAEIKIFDILGKEVVSSHINSSEAQIDMTNQESGIYFIYIKTEDSNSTIKKIIIY